MKRYIINYKNGSSIKYNKKDFINELYKLLQYNVIMLSDGFTKMYACYSNNSFDNTEYICHDGYGRSCCRNTKSDLKYYYIDENCFNVTVL